MSRRSEQLLTIAREFIRVHEEWRQDENRQNPDETYWDAVESMKAFETGDIPGDIRPLAARVSEFFDEVDAFDNRANMNDEYPHDSFWKAVDGIRSMLERPGRRELPPLESIKELAAMPYMQHVQICKIYGFTDRRGNPMTRLVQMELDTPGSVIGEAAKGKGLIDGRDWSDPRLDELDAEDSAADRAVEQISRKGRQSRKESGKCPESLRELWEQGVGAAQAAKMLQQSDSEVAKQFADWDELKVFTSRVYELSDKKVPIGEICKQLRTDPNKVQAVLKDRPATVGAA